MVSSASDPLFLRVLRGEKTPVPPVWLMRQAGRYLPEYLATRAEAGSFLDLCFNPPLACEVTMQPIRRYDFDAAILFSDILVIPHALGQEVRFEAGEGPRLSPLASPGDLDKFASAAVVPALEPVFEAVKLIRETLDPAKALIGFAGAPWTVATYMLAGGSLKDPGSLRLKLYEDPAFLTRLIEVLTDKTIDYLIAQIDAGADAVQLFDSWASGLPGPVLDMVSIKPLARIAAAIKEQRPHAPVILFPKGVGEKTTEYAHLPGVSGLGIDYEMDPAWARANLSAHVTVQGGLDPLLLIHGGERYEKGVDAYLRLFHDVPHIFNVGHGVTPQTSPELVGDLVKRIRDFHA